MLDSDSLDNKTIREIESWIEQKRREIQKLKNRHAGQSGDARYHHKEKPGVHTQAALYDMYDATELELKKILDEMRSMGVGGSKPPEMLLGEVDAIKKFIHENKGLTKYILKRGWGDFSFARMVCEIIAEHPRIARVPHDQLRLPK